MQLWPFTPEGGIKETLEWKTEVIRSRSDEQRIALRPFPRTTLDIDFILSEQEYALVTVLSKKYFLEKLIVPFWKELLVVGSVDSTDTTFAVDTTIRRFDSQVLVVDQDGTRVLADILQIDPGQITLTEAVGRVFTNAFIVPVGYFHFQKALEIEKGSEDYYKTRASFVCTDEYVYQGAIDFPSYLGFYVITDRPVVDSPLKETFQREFKVLDNGFGPLSYSDEFDYPIAMSFLSWRNINLGELYRIRYFLSTLKGKQGQFWVPTWNKDFIVAQGILSADVDVLVQDNDQSQHFEPFHIGILLLDGTFYFRKVISMNIHGSLEQLTLDSALGADISPSQIERVFKLTLMRSDTDKVNINYLPSGNTTVRIPVMEVPHEL